MDGSVVLPAGEDSKSSGREMHLQNIVKEPSPDLAAPLMLRGPNRPDLRRDECLADLLAATARLRPQHPALIWGDRVVSYGELEAASSVIASALHRRGACAGQVVGLFMPRGADLLIAQAGITRSGAAWLPLDADTPLERVKTCLLSAGACGLVTARDCLPRLAGLPVPVWAAEDLLTEKKPLSPNPGELTHCSPEPDSGRPRPQQGEQSAGSIFFQHRNSFSLSHRMGEGRGEGGVHGEKSLDPQPSILAPSPSDPAYVIYTSGSTGQPKGIVISHRGICHFLRSENELLGVRADDRVYQGFSVAFDMSFEEIWIAYLVGATLWIAPPALVADPELLAQALTRERITVLHAVPTLMGLIDDPLPTVRLINLGGEACPEGLVTRLARPGRKLFNTYGPTEASVSASLAELKPGEPVSIGMPLPNYGLLVVDNQRRPLPPGETGELCITGPGLATGYLGRPDLTAEKFVPNPLAENSNEEKMYLTGDLARIEPGGPVYCLGRADGQVKIRGYRVELDEIVSALTARPGVAAAAAVVRPFGALEQIVAFVVPVANQKIEPSQLRQALAARLPQYMVPSHFEVLAELPRLVSGKIDSHALRELPLKIPSLAAAPPDNEDQAALYAALKKLFPGQPFDSGMDFFFDLGGHSLLAARLVSLLRDDARYATVGVQDIYRERQLAGIARAMEHQRRNKPQSNAPSYVETPLWRRSACGLAQAVAIPFFVLLHILDWLAPFFVYHYNTGDEGDSVARAVMYSLATFVLAQLATFGVAIAGKTAIGRLKAGRYPLWGVTYFRWWLAGKFSELPDVYLLAATPWLPLYLRALGARIGRDVMMDTISVAAPELLVVEDGVSLGTFVNIENARVENGMLVLGTVHFKRDSVVDSYAILENNTLLGERARLSGQSALAAGKTIPDGEIWEGAPARPSNQITEPLPPRPVASLAQRAGLATLFAITAIAVSVLFFLPTFPAFMLIDWLDAHTLDVFDSEPSPLVAYGFFFLLAVPASGLFVSLTMLVTAGLCRLLPRQTAGISSVHSFAFWRKQVVTMILDSSLRVLHGLYASVFAPTWLRWLGVKVGRHAEVSTAEGMVPELLSLGEDSFIADGAMLGDEELRGGWMILKPTRIGNRSFVGNGAYVADGATIPDDVLIGVQTRTPKNEQLASGQTWMGSPPLLLPAREQLTGFPVSLTFRPSLERRLARGFIEALRLVLPLALVIATGYLIIVLIMPLAENYGWGMRVANALAFAGCLYGLASFLIVVALKWVLIGRYRPRVAPMWTPFVWISEAVTNLYESLAVPNFLEVLRGTPMLPWALRLLGVRIGKGVFLNTTDLTEFDCVAIGDQTELNAWCGPQTHLFEDRVMKIGRVEIGARVTVGARTTILYDTRIGDAVQLGPLTLVAKGERLPAATRWEGSPAAPVQEK